MRPRYRLMLLFVLTALVTPGWPAQAAQKFLLSQHRLAVVKGGDATIGRLSRHPDIAAATTTNFSDRRGAPIGVLMVNGHLYQGNTQKRCLLSIDATGRQVAIGYKLPSWSYQAVEAGPCLVRWTSGRRSGVYLAEREERFSHSFVTAPAERSVVCLPADKSFVVHFRFRGSLWQMPPKMAEWRVERCINLDGGRQLALQAVNPAVLVVVRDSPDP